MGRQLGRVSWQVEVEVSAARRCVLFHRLIQGEVICPGRRNQYALSASRGILNANQKKVTNTYKGRTITCLQPGEWCDHCGEGILSGEDALATQKRLLEWRASIEKQESLAIARIRRRLGITQAEAARIAGGGKNAFTRSKSCVCCPRTRYNRTLLFVGAIISPYSLEVKP